jgi:hypothetical protein
MLVSDISYLMSKASTQWNPASCIITPHYASGVVTKPDHSHGAWGALGARCINQPPASPIILIFRIQKCRAAGAYSRQVYPLIYFGEVRRGMHNAKLTSAFEVATSNHAGPFPFRGATLVALDPIFNLWKF